MNINWQELLVPTGSILEIFLRGTFVYISLLLILRFVLNRQSGGLGIADLLVIVLLASAAQNAMTNNYKSVTEGIVLVATVVFWSYLLDWLGFHIPALQRFLRPPPLPLVKNGRMLRHNMRKELITEDELMSQLRQQGIDDVSEVKSAYMEADGFISVITHHKTESSNRNSPERQIDKIR